jgi:hypothetical protein
MEMTDDELHELSDALAKYEATLGWATILDRDGQPIATGTITPANKGVRGAFFPEGPVAASAIESRAAALRRSDGSEQKFAFLRRCKHSNYTNHFHFELRM